MNCSSRNSEIPKGVRCYPSCGTEPAQPTTPVTEPFERGTSPASSSDSDEHGPRRNRSQVGAHARTAESIFRTIGVLVCLAGCAPVVAVILGALVLDEAIEFSLVPIFTLMSIAVGLVFISLGRSEVSPLRRLAIFIVGCVFGLGGPAHRDALPRFFMGCAGTVECSRCWRV